MQSPAPASAVHIRGRVIEAPRSTDAHSVLALHTGGGALPRTPLLTEFSPVCDESFARGRSAAWRDDLGSFELRDGFLVASGTQDMTVHTDLALKQGRVTVEMRGDRQGGIILGYHDPRNLILAFYSPKQQALGFHEVRDGDWGPWVGWVPTPMVRGGRVRLEVRFDELQVSSRLTDEAGNAASAVLIPARLGSEGLVGLYHDNHTQLGPQEFSTFRVDAATTRPHPDIVTVRMPEVTDAVALGLFRGDVVSVRGRLVEPGVVAAEGSSPVRRERSGRASSTLFPTHVPGGDWQEFHADGFTRPVGGVVYRTGDPVTNGMALGGVDTGCIDIETSGLLGYCTLFNTHVPRRGPLNLPLLGVSVGGETWVLCDPQPKQGSGGSQVPVEPVLSELNLQGVHTADEIHYWGHYPVADMEFITNAPVGVGLRAWSPFLPGDVVSSMLPGIVFEVHLRNRTDQPQSGTLAFSFPGPTPKEAGCETFEQRALVSQLPGVMVGGRLASYAIAVPGDIGVRTGGGLGVNGRAWARIDHTLPATRPEDPSASVAHDFVLRPGEARIVRFLLTWSAPTWKGGGYNWAEAGNTFTHMYDRYYPSAEETAEQLAREREALLKRILAWQEVVYREHELPLWLRDSLINVLYMITEDGYWAQKAEPLPDWVRADDGLFGMNECPRGCPQIECIPCSFYGSLPLVYFFPKLQLSTIRGYQGYQLPDGAPPWIFGGCTGQTPPIDFACPTRGYQFASNGISLAAIVDRFLLCRDTPDGELLRELYPMVRRSVEHTVSLRSTPSYSIGERIISMPDGNEGTEWFEAPEPGWAGVTAHIGGLHLAELRIAERMAQRMGDEAFARQCAEWISAAQGAMESRLWDERGFYLNYLEPETGRRSDLVFGYQLDGEWILAHHGLPKALPDERTSTVLETIRRCNVAVTKYGAVNYANADGTVANPGGYGAYSYFPPELLMLAMTYMYEGQREFGIELARKAWHNLVCTQGYTWDMPNIMRGDVDTGERTFGNDYYQDMMLWSLPAALAGEDVSAPCRPGGLVDRMLEAARG